MKWGLLLLQIVGKGFQDLDKKVRGQAMFALGELAAHCQPEMSKHAGEALPHVFAAMAEDDATLQEQACYALDSFCENLGGCPACPHLFLYQHCPHGRAFAGSSVAYAG